MDFREGVELARKHGLTKTIYAIGTEFNEDCYKKIFAVAIKEAGGIDNVIAILKEAGDPAVAVQFAIVNSENLLEKHKDNLIAILEETRDAEFYYVFAMFIDVSESQMDRLVRGIRASRDHDWIRLFSMHVSLADSQRQILYPETNIGRA